MPSVNRFVVPGFVARPSDRLLHATTLNYRPTDELAQRLQLYLARALPRTLLKLTITLWTSSRHRCRRQRVFYSCLDEITTRAPDQRSPNTTNSCVRNKAN